jgi:hypothetical protein
MLKNIDVFLLLCLFLFIMVIIQIYNKENFIVACNKNDNNCCFGVKYDPNYQTCNRGIIINN